MAVVVGERVLFRACVGIAAGEVPRDRSPCARAAFGDDVHVVADFGASGRCQVPGGEDLGSYAGAPLHTPDGFVVGDLCVMDRGPRHLEPRQLEALKALARQAEAHVRLRAQATELVRSNAELAKLSLVASRTDTSIVITNRDGRAEWVNDAFARNTGYSREELLGHQPGSILQGKGTDRATVERMRRSLRASQGFTEEVLNYRKDGTPFWASVNVSPVLDAEGNLAWYIGVSTDVTVRRKAEEAAREGRARMRAIWETAAEGIITIDGRGVIEEFNPAAERIFGYLAAEVVGGNVAVLMPEPHRSRHDGYIARYLSEGTPHIVGSGRELSAVRKDGTLVPIFLSVSEVRLGEQNLFTGFVRDISDIKEVDRMKNEFVSVASHELRTPLTSIRGALGLLEGGVAGVLPSQAQELVGIARSNSDRLIRLVNDLLDLEKIEAGRMDLHLQPIDPSWLVSTTLDGLRAMVDEAGVSVVADARGAPRFDGDRDRLVQVLTNLVSNAVKFSPRGAQVDLRIEPRGERVRLLVVDRGPGIPEEDQRRLFQRFQQVDPSDSRRKAGSGLGLAISKAIVEQHGGQIGIESRSGEGSTFWFELPLHGAKPDGAGGSRP